MEEKHHRACSKKMRSNARELRQHLTPQEQLLWHKLRDNRMGIKFRRQVVIDDKYVVDFACLEKKLVIEIDGSQHADNPQDKERTAYLEGCGFEVLRFWNDEINKNLESCLNMIYARCMKGND